MSVDDVDDADALVQQLAESEDAWADGSALYGPGGLFDNMRKSMLAVIKLRVRDTLGDRKLTGLADFIDDLAHADSGYRAFLDTHLVKQAEWRALDAGRQRLWAGLRLHTARGYDARRMGV
ncbi:MAG: hypothetical protein H0U66_06195 [Gemmatimonadaceae bacterium]|nr:hypothetical protein [Gemmatimonadaceae bacterium]